jgi:CRP-like cAMP-binding protein
MGALRHIPLCVMRGGGSLYPGRLPEAGDVLSAVQPQYNLILAALPEEVQLRLRPHLERMWLPAGKVLHESGEQAVDAYFPIDCVISRLYVTESGASTEVSLVGNDGFVGVALLLGGRSLPTRVVVESGGAAYRLKGPWFIEEINRHGELLVMALRYTQALVTQIAQTAVCNRFHTIDQRLCRRLLMNLDRSSGNQVPMTQETLAQLLGVRREGITAAATKLHRLGIIDSSRGHITVRDRGRLEQLSCECYAAVRQETDRLLHGIRTASGR